MSFLFVFLSFFFLSFFFVIFLLYYLSIISKIMNRFSKGFSPSLGKGVEDDVLSFISCECHGSIFWEKIHIITEFINSFRVFFNNDFCWFLKTVTISKGCKDALIGLRKKTTIAYLLFYDELIKKRAAKELPIGLISYLSENLE